ncbi:hypothetical protein SLE2022_378740 [Rubroshorea leprosula]
MAMQLHDAVVLLVSIVGFFSLLKPVIGFFNWVWVVFLRRPKNLKKYGSWAVVTGSTDGIGKALAFELASKGLNLLLVGRNPSKLESTSGEIRGRYGTSVEIRTVVLDLGKSSGEEISREIGDAIEGLDVGILINNAGVAYPYSMFFHEADSELNQSIVQVNAEAATWVTRAVLPVMLKKKKGAIVNIGSASGSVPSYPLNAIYAATKAYLTMFSRSISVEYKKNGIDIQCQIPFFVATKMAKIRKSSFLIPSPEIYSKASIRHIGYEPVCIPNCSHSLLWAVIHALPVTVFDHYLFNYNLGLRKRALAKYSIKAKVK